MRNGHCPSCGGTEIYAARNGLGFGDATYVHLRPQLPEGFRGAAIPHCTNEVWAYLCAGCGLVEHRLHDDAAAEWVKQNWVRVQADTEPVAPGTTPAA